MICPAGGLLSSPVVRCLRPKTGNEAAYPSDQAFRLVSDCELTSCRRPLLLNAIFAIACTQRVWSAKLFLEEYHELGSHLSKTWFRFYHGSVRNLSEGLHRSLPGEQALRLRLRIIGRR